MEVRTVTALLLILALYYIISVATQLFMDVSAQRASVFVGIMIGVLISGIATVVFGDIGIPA